MDNHAEGQESGKIRAVSKLDWPTPEMLAAANRARAKAFKEMVVEGVSRLKALIVEHLHAAKPAKVPIDRRH
jgi:hypothetical protein